MLMTDASSSVGSTATTSQQNEYLATYCSRRCPGSVILLAYDLAVALRDAGVPVIGGFGTPVEREMLRVLLRGRAPVTIVEARGPRVRVPSEWRVPLDDGRLQVLSPFPDVSRVTAETSERRNRIVAEMASAVLVVHASPGGRTEALAREIDPTRTPLLTLATDDGANDNLIALGATPIEPKAITWPPVLHELRSPNLPLADPFPKTL